MSGRGEEEIKRVRRTIWRWYHTHRRDLPWRKTRDPYQILVSEIMLQQTQVERVIPYYERFIKRFPTAEALAQTPLKDVLELWSGLGYNKRARYLWATAKKVTLTPGVRVTWPETIEELRRLPGVGEATAAMIMSVAFGQRVPLTNETNVRQVIHHFFFKGKPRQQERVYTELAWRLLPKRIPAREWNYAMMDYGALVVRPKHRADRLQLTVKRQSQFKDSNRYWRGEIVRRLVQAGGSVPIERLTDIPELEDRLAGLIHDQLIARRNQAVRVR